MMLQPPIYDSPFPRFFAWATLPLAQEEGDSSPRSRDTASAECHGNPHLVGGIPTPLKTMKVSWDHYSQYMESHKIHVPNHQPGIMSSQPHRQVTAPFYRPCRQMWSPLDPRRSSRGTLKCMAPAAPSAGHWDPGIWLLKFTKILLKLFTVIFHQSCHIFEKGDYYGYLWIIAQTKNTTCQGFSSGLLGRTASEPGRSGSRHPYIL